MANDENAQNSEIACLDRLEMDREYVRRKELEEIIKRSVQQALADYNHKCVLNLSAPIVRLLKPLY